MSSCCYCLWQAWFQSYTVQLSTYSYLVTLQQAIKVKLIWVFAHKRGWIFSSSSRNMIKFFCFILSYKQEISITYSSIKAWPFNILIKQPFEERSPFLQPIEEMLCFSQWVLWLFKLTLSLVAYLIWHWCFHLSHLREVKGLVNRDLVHLKVSVRLLFLFNEIIS